MNRKNLSKPPKLKETFEQSQVGYFESKDDIYEHILTISNISVNDAGEYKCQLVNSNPTLEQVINWLFSTYF